MLKILIVGLGGFLGSVLRYLLANWVHRILDNPWYPYGTMAVNIIGCLVIGLLAGLAENKGYFGSQTRLFLLVGFLGGFTTFSAFCNETFTMLGNGQTLASISNIAASVTLGLIAVFAGAKIANLL